MIVFFLLLLLLLLFEIYFVPSLFGANQNIVLCVSEMKTKGTFVAPLMISRDVFFNFRDEQTDVGPHVALMLRSFLCLMDEKRTGFEEILDRIGSTMGKRRSSETQIPKDEILRPLSLGCFSIH